MSLQLLSAKISDQNLKKLILYVQFVYHVTDLQKYLPCDRFKMYVSCDRSELVHFVSLDHS